MTRAGERLLGSQGAQCWLWVESGTQVCAGSEDRLRRGRGKKGRDGGKWEDREAAGLICK